VDRFSFTVVARDGAARRGLLRTPHGEIETPAFMPVGTLGAVKGLGVQELEASGASIMLSNLYHLALRPGIETIAELGGLHSFTGWQRPILTDSGGFQVFSLAGLRRVDANGVTFRSHLDGSELRFTPERVVDLQLRLGVDIAMMLDECPPWPVTEEEAEAAWERTLGWARRAREGWPESGSGLFGIVQGSLFPRLRERAVAELTKLDFDGYAIGGVSVGEEVADQRRVVKLTAPLLPEDKPRYLMGVGTPQDLLFAVRQGVDMFDCVLPSRNARHGLLYTREGTLRIRNARFRDDPRPLDAACGCPVCHRVSRAFVHHLFRARELTGKVLATVHNLRYYLDFMADLRKATASGTLDELAGRSDVRSAGSDPGE